MSTEQPYTPSMDEARGRYSDGAHHQGAHEPYPGAHLDAWDRFIAQVRRDAAREALMGLQRFASECIDGKHGEIDAETFAGWHHTWAAAMQHRVDYYYPEETR